MDKVPVTIDGFARLKDELRQLKEVERPRISQEIGVAREHGDLRENAEYHAAKEKQGMVEARILELEDHLARADVIDTSKLSGERIAFGAYVKIENSDTGEIQQFRLIGPDEVKFNEGAISITAPMARALIGKRPGDEVQVKAPGGTRDYEVVAVSYRGFPGS